MLAEVHKRGGVAVSSNFARQYAPEIAAFASLGYLTTAVRRDFFSRKWRVTSLGLISLEAGA